MIKKMEKKDELMSKLIVQKSKPLFGLWVSHLTLNGAKLLKVKQVRQTITFVNGLY